MEFSREKRLKARLAGDRRGDLYPHSLQFYLQPPTENISLAEFENFAIDRLKLLKVVENLGVSYVKGSDEYKSRLEREIRKLKFPFRALVEDDYDARRKDHISHFILRLAYCQSEDLRRWFIQQEMDLFRYRFNELTGDLVEKFLKYVNLSYGAAQVGYPWNNAYVPGKKTSKLMHILHGLPKPAPTDKLSANQKLLTTC
ncbi:DNA primase large subunit isoform X7 [Mauremys reevesii]|uniref:DNA primase large subunit isoform X7 n=1 Tax=Mauremys reevesii TaxID=260615 RepID=UPI0019400566|nr:DNA primase large subunit isoform X7 [Mauremys reevesii]